MRERATLGDKGTKNDGAKPAQRMQMPESPTFRTPAVAGSQRLTVRPSVVLQLQRVAGNRATRSVVQPSPADATARELDQNVSSGTASLHARQDLRASPLNGTHHLRPITLASSRQGTDPVHRITEEDANQAVISFAPSATTHGYTQDGLDAIVRHRHNEIQVGRARTIVLGLGADENNPYFGRLVYNCEVRDGVHHIHVFHAHGGQTEPRNARGY